MHNLSNVKCTSCGYEFDISDAAVHIDKHGFDHPPYEETLCCPLCGGSFEEKEEDEDGDIINI